MRTKVRFNLPWLYSHLLSFVFFFHFLISISFVHKPALDPVLLWSERKIVLIQRRWCLSSCALYTKFYKFILKKINTVKHYFKLLVIFFFFRILWHWEHFNKSHAVWNTFWSPHSVYKGNKDLSLNSEVSFLKEAWPAIL